MLQIRRSVARRSSRLAWPLVLAAAAVPLSAGAVVGAAPLPGPAPAQEQAHYELTTMFSGATLGISQPDDLTALGDRLFVAFQNGVGPQGQPSPTGNLDSTVVEMSPDGVVEGTWNLPGHCDGLTADPYDQQVLATVNEDANSSLFTISPQNATPVQYAYSPAPLPHNGGTDAISIVDGQILVSASAPGTTGAPAPQPTYPAVYSVRLDPATKVAAVAPLFSDEASATVANAGPGQGTSVTLGLTDPDSNAVVPGSSPRFVGDFVLDSQGDQEQVYVRHPGQRDQRLSVLHLSQSIDDTAWASAGPGALYITDHADDLVDVLHGSFVPGTAFVSVTPCDANSAPSTCPGPGYPPDYLGTLNMATGQITPVDLAPEVLQTQSLLFADLGGPYGESQAGQSQAGSADGQGR